MDTPLRPGTVPTRRSAPRRSLYPPRRGRGIPLRRRPARPNPSTSAPPHPARAPETSPAPLLDVATTLPPDTIPTAPVIVTDLVELSSAVQSRPSGPPRRPVGRRGPPRPVPTKTITEGADTLPHVQAAVDLLPSGKLDDMAASEIPTTPDLSTRASYIASSIGVSDPIESSVAAPRRTPRRPPRRPMGRRVPLRPVRGTSDVISLNADAPQDASMTLLPSKATPDQLIESEVSTILDSPVKEEQVAALSRPPSPPALPHTKFNPANPPKVHVRGPPTVTGIERPGFAHDRITPTTKQLAENLSMLPPSICGRRSPADIIQGLASHPSTYGFIGTPVYMGRGPPPNVPIPPINSAIEHEESSINSSPTVSRPMPAVPVRKPSARISQNRVSRIPLRRHTRPARVLVSTTVYSAPEPVVSSDPGSCESEALDTTTALSTEEIYSPPESPRGSLEQTPEIAHASTPSRIRAIGLLRPTPHRRVPPRRIRPPPVDVPSPPLTIPDEENSAAELPQNEESKLVLSEEELSPCTQPIATIPRRTPRPVRRVAPLRTLVVPTVDSSEVESSENLAVVAELDNPEACQVPPPPTTARPMYNSIGRVPPSRRPHVPPGRRIPVSRRSARRMPVSHRAARRMPVRLRRPNPVPGPDSLVPSPVESTVLDDVPHSPTKSDMQSDNDMSTSPREVNSNVDTPASEPPTRVSVPDSPVPPLESPVFDDFVEDFAHSPIKSDAQSDTGIDTLGTSCIPEALPIVSVPPVDQQEFDILDGFDIPEDVTPASHVDQHQLTVENDENPIDTLGTSCIPEARPIVSVPPVDQHEFDILDGFDIPEDATPASHVDQHQLPVENDDNTVVAADTAGILYTDESVAEHFEIENEENFNILDNAFTLEYSPPCYDTRYEDEQVDVLSAFEETDVVGVETSTIPDGIWHDNGDDINALSPEDAYLHQDNDARFDILGASEPAEVYEEREQVLEEHEDSGNHTHLEYTIGEEQVFNVLDGFDSSPGEEQTASQYQEHHFDILDSFDQVQPDLNDTVLVTETPPFSPKPELDILDAFDEAPVAKPSISNQDDLGDPSLEPVITQTVRGNRIPHIRRRSAAGRAMPGPPARVPIPKLASAGSLPEVDIDELFGETTTVSSDPVPLVPTVTPIPPPRRSAPRRYRPMPRLRRRAP